MIKKYILFLLSKIAKLIITKHNPFIIGVTWTVGKTTTTNFTYSFLRNIYKDEVYMSPYDYNWEFGLPLTILQSKSPNKNLFLWLVVFIKWLALYFSKNYPKYLVLEYWIDHIWEMKFLTNIVSPDIGIVLNVSPNHVTQFPDYNDYINEKTLLWKVAKKVVYNIDNEILDKTFSSYKNSFSYWIKNKSAWLYGYKIQSDIKWLKFSIKDWEEELEVSYNILGSHQVYNILPTFLLWKILGFSLFDIYESLKNIQPQKWRWTILKWVKDSIIIDWSYNGWFLSITSWIEYVKTLDNTFNKILFLGEMRELWTESKKLHLELANILLGWWYDYIVLVWEEMKNYVFEPLKEKFSENNVFHYNNSRIAWEKIREIIQDNSAQSLIYVKWSQNTIFLEEWIKNFLSDIQDVKNLCRQSPKWQKTKDDFFSQIL